MDDRPENPQEPALLPEILSDRGPSNAVAAPEGPEGSPSEGRGRARRVLAAVGVGGFSLIVAILAAVPGWADFLFKKEQPDHTDDQRTNQAPVVIPGASEPTSSAPETTGEPPVLDGSTTAEPTSSDDASTSDDRPGPKSKPTPTPTTTPTWTVSKVSSVNANDNKRIVLTGPHLPSSGLLRLSKPIDDDRRFSSPPVQCRIEPGPPPWCMLDAKRGNDGLRPGDELELAKAPP